ncbi:hypothetical protein [Oceanobacillus salinisoli]|uniref:hypothetical protein n=1 Tax=Oceanobacillus salinisoli TaxID=2678611 RepID=UPI0012E0CC4E|nr:hypothetical protein [Oceanobacillus salinisoli]
MAIKPRIKGEKYRPTVEVLRERNGKPTKVIFNGRVFAWVPDDYINGNKNKVGR